MDKKKIMSEIESSVAYVKATIDTADLVKKQYDAFIQAGFDEYKAFVLTQIYYNHALRKML